MVLKAATTLALRFLFLVIVLPVGVVMKVAGKDPLRRRFDPDSESYWIERRPPGPPPASMKDQY